MSRALFTAAALSFFAAAGCASNVAADGDAVGDSASDLSGRTPLGLSALQNRNWLVTSSAFQDGDVLALRLYADGSYVRLRCYGAGCAKPVPETDRFTAFRSKGKQYIEFDSFVRVLLPPRPPTPAAPGGPPPKPAGGSEYDDQSVVADTYELVIVGAQIKLRKIHTARWTTLGTVDDPTLCDASGGTWGPAPSPPPEVPPTTKGQDPARSPPAGAVPVPPSVTAVTAPDAASSCRCAAGESFVGGAAGCIHTPSIDEDACDTSNGSYTDDDATKLGTFCACGLGRTLSDSGCVDL